MTEVDENLGSGLGQAARRGGVKPANRNPTSNNGNDTLFGAFGFLALKDCLIIWFSNLSTLSVPDEDNFRKVPCALKLNTH